LLAYKLRENNERNSSQKY
jgi:hypothetical protein